MKFAVRNILIFCAVFAYIAVMAGSASAQTAEDLYKTKCAVCHAADGTGNTPAGKKMEVKSFSAPEVAKNSDASWIDVTKAGKGKMPGYTGKLTDDQIKDVIKYVRSLAKGK
jgi:mono/diheme cytochrome c family protein